MKISYQRELTVLVALAAVAQPVLAEEDWRFRVSPYVWFAGLKGDVATIPPLPAAPVDVSPSDALDDTQASLMVIFDAKKGRHGAYLDLLYTDVESDDELVPQPINLVLRSRTKSTVFTLAYQYEIYSQDGAVVDLLAGARYSKVDSELRFRGGLGLLAGRSISNDESWVDPVVGVKARAPLGDSRFYVSGGGAVGGFGVGADHFYELTLNVGYQWSDAIGTALGYRMFDVDYEDDGFVYDVRQQGWQLGLTWAF
jgi:hypothetical protein